MSVEGDEGIRVIHKGFGQCVDVPKGLSIWGKKLTISGLLREALRTTIKTLSYHCCVGEFIDSLTTLNAGGYSLLCGMSMKPQG